MRGGAPMNQSPPATGPTSVRAEKCNSKPKLSSSKVPSPSAAPRAGRRSLLAPLRAMRIPSPSSAARRAKASRRGAGRPARFVDPAPDAEAGGEPPMEAAVETVLLARSGPGDCYASGYATLQDLASGVVAHRLPCALPLGREARVEEEDEDRSEEGVEVSQVLSEGRRCHGQPRSRPVRLSSPISRPAGGIGGAARRLPRKIWARPSAQGRPRPGSRGADEEASAVQGALTGQRSAVRVAPIPKNPPKSTFGVSSVEVKASRIPAPSAPALPTSKLLRVTVLSPPPGMPEGASPSEDASGWASASASASAWEEHGPEPGAIGGFFLCSDEPLGGGARCSRVGGTGSFESDGTGSTGSSSSGPHHVRPRIVSFERDQATNESISVIGTSSTVTTTATYSSAGAYRSGEDEEAESETTGVSMTSRSSATGTSFGGCASKGVASALAPTSLAASRDDATIATLEEALRADRRWLW